MFGNMRVSTRLAIGFGLMILMLLGSALFGLDRLRTVSGASASVMDFHYPRAQMVRDTIDANDRARLLARDLLFADTPEEITQARKELAEARAQVHKRLDEINNTLKRPESRRMLDNIAVAVKEIGVIYDRIDAIVETDKEAALVIIRNEYTVAQEKMIKGLLDLNSYIGSAMTQANEDAQATAKSTQDVIVYATALAVVLAILLA